jgi:hypothetical protein
MAQRNSEYARQERESYETPRWVTLALLPHIPARISRIWEPAAGTGQMVRALAERPNTIVLASDLVGSPNVAPHDFLSGSAAPIGESCIVTNPPFQQAQRFIERALELTHRNQGFVAMLLRADFDHAKGRSHLFANCRAFSKKLVLTKRIVWFVDPLTGKPKASPSENHVWILWDHTHRGPPTIAYYLENAHAGKIDRQRLQAQNRQEDRQDHAGEGPQGRPGETGCLHTAEENGIE